jgi:hypothetical protein
VARQQNRDGRYNAAWLAVALVAVVAGVVIEQFAPPREDAATLSYEAWLTGRVMNEGGGPASLGGQTLVVLAYRARHFDPASGPTGQPVKRFDSSAASLPATFEISSREGMPYWLVAVVDADGSGVEDGPRAGDRIGWTGTTVQSPGDGVEIVLRSSTPWAAAAGR